MNLLFIDHECHRKTCSADFFLECLQTRFKIQTHYYSRCYHLELGTNTPDCDVAVSWEFLISRWRFFFKGKRNIFVPMYDNELLSYWPWKRIAWSGIGVISFCDKVSAHARRCGVTNLLDVRYFPDPSFLPQREGDFKRVFLWERGELDLKDAEKIFPPSSGFVIDVKHADEFTNREDYLERVAQSGIVVAPRRKEGIGMVFLEAMAMGKCVVAYNDATMNEYIRDGEDGILFDVGPCAPITDAQILHVRNNVRRTSEKLRLQWLSDAEKIAGFIEAQTPQCPSFANRLKMTIVYPLFLMEGICHLLKNFVW